jgi:RNA polymerase sigma-70 factor, ECF subfamily
VAAADGFEAFFRAEHTRVVALGMAMTGDRELGKEVAQEAFLRAFRDWDRLATYEHPAQWVRRVVVNLSMDAHRRRRSARHALERLTPSAAAAAAGTDAPAALVPDPVADEWWQVVLELPDRQRAAVALHHLDDLPIAEVARVLGVTTGTVKASLAHARATLAKRLGPLQPDHDAPHRSEEEERRP